MSERKSLKDWCIENNKKYILNEWDYSKNSDTPDDIAYASHQKRYFICEKGHSHLMQISQKTRGYKCSVCSGAQVLKGYNDFESHYPEFAKQWHPTKNGNLTPDQVSKGSNKEIWWICKEGHEFLQKVSAYVYSNGSCPCCSNRRVLPGYNDLATTNPELLKEWDYEKNSKLSPTEVVPGSSKSAWWICKYGHEWKAPIRKRAQNGTQCPICINKKVKEGFNDILTTHPHLAKELHPTKNQGIDISTVYAFSETILWWVCDKGHEYEASAKSKANGIKCPICTNHKIVEDINSICITHPDIAAMWHPTKNKKLTPAEVSTGSNKIVWWKCEDGHEWQATIYNQIKNVNKCPFCANQKVLTGYNDLAVKYPELIKEIHPTKNKNFDPQKTIHISSKKIWWVCKSGHEWRAAISERVNGSGCPICKNKKVLIGFNDLLTTHPQIALDWHPTKNEDLKPTDVMAGSDKKVWWTCKCGHERYSKISNRVNSSGCPICSNNKRMSYPEFVIEFFISRHTKTIHNYTDLGFELDIYLPDEKIGIEYDGAYFHKNPKKDVDKNKKCETLGIKLYRIREYPLTSLNSSSIDIIRPLTQLGLEESIKTLIKDIFCIEEEINIDENTESINNLRELKELENSFASKYPHLVKYWHPTKNGNLKPTNISAGSPRKVWWVCDKGHEWFAPISSKKLDTCPICLNKTLLVGFNDLASNRPDLASEWHDTKNGSLKPSDVTERAHKKVWWKCKHGHEWQTSVDSRSSRNYGCPTCANLKLLVGFNDLATYAPHLISEWHPTKNGPLTPQDVVYGTDRRVWWKCSDGHEWITSVRKRAIEGTGCPQCTKWKLEVGVNDLLTVCPELASQWHPTKNGTLKPTDVKYNDKEKVVWWLKDGREFKANIFNRYRTINDKKITND